MRRLQRLEASRSGVLAFSMAAATPATADFKVEMPDAETGEFAVEPIGDIGQDPLAAHSGELSPVTEFESMASTASGAPSSSLEQERPHTGPGPVDPL